MSEHIELSVIIPAYNEENRLGAYLSEILDFLAQKRMSYEVIVVDDGSTDQTSVVVQEFLSKNSSVRLVRLERNMGKGYAVKSGMHAAVGKLRLFTDSDGATPIHELERLLPAVRNGADVVIASRALQNNSCVINAHLHRKILGGVFNTLVKCLAVRGIADTQCGFKLFTQSSAEVLFPLQRIYDFGFDVELLYLCGKKKKASCRGAD